MSTIPYVEGQATLSQEAFQSLSEVPSSVKREKNYWKGVSWAATGTMAGVVAFATLATTVEAISFCGKQVPSIVSQGGQRLLCPFLTECPTQRIHEAGVVNVVAGVVAAVAAGTLLIPAAARVALGNGGLCYHGFAQAAEALGIRSTKSNSQN